MIADQITPGGAIYFKALVKPLVNLIWLAGLVFLLGSLDHALAGPARGAAARGALRARAGMTASLVLAAVVAVAAVLLVAVPFLREPTPREDRLREPREARQATARARRGARSRARRAEGARVRPPHGQALRHRLPRARRHATAGAPPRRCRRWDLRGDARRRERHAGAAAAAARDDGFAGRGLRRDAALLRHHAADAALRNRDRDARDRDHAGDPRRTGSRRSCSRRSCSSSSRSSSGSRGGSPTPPSRRHRFARSTARGIAPHTSCARRPFAPRRGGGTTRLRHELLELDTRRERELRELGAAVYAGDDEAAERVKSELTAIDDERSAKEDEMRAIDEATREHLERGRLHVQPTVVKPPAEDESRTPSGP